MAKEIVSTKYELRKLIESYDYLDVILRYDHESGLLYWKKRFIGKIAGTYVKSWNYQKAFIKVVIKKMEFKAHRLAWILHHQQQIPDKMVIDHINGDSTDNRICNLRLATNHENSMNSTMPKISSTGFKGVSKHKNKYRAYINYKFKHIHLGMFNTPEEASEAYNNAALELYGEFAKINA